MKAVILCGGRGTRLSEETKVTPKPLVTIGGKPIVSHIINHYKNHGISEFLLAVGYLGEQFTEYFSANNLEDFFGNHADKATNIRIVDTGLDTLTGGRLLRLKEELKDETFLLTYGDGLANVDVSRTMEFHKSHNKIATITAVRPPARFGVIRISDSNRVEYFQEKNQIDTGWINGGFFIFNPEIFQLLENDSTVLEDMPLHELTLSGNLMAYKHEGFWQCMDTIRDREFLEELWESGSPPWL
jgi:glucose-1-phosphate cytidylyltransferase